MQGNVDGAYFGTTFPHLLLMTYPSIRPAKQQELYVPRVFGFKLHASNVAAQPAAISAAAVAAGSHSAHAAGSVRHTQVSLWPLIAINLGSFVVKCMLQHTECNKLPRDGLHH